MSGSPEGKGDPSSELGDPGSRWSRDAAVILILCAAAFAVFSYYDLFETLHDSSRDTQEYHLDEVVVTLALLPLFLYFYSRRRMKEVRKQHEERLRTEELLRRSRRLYGGLVDSMSEGIVVFDAQARIVQANLMAMTIFGINTDNSGRMFFRANLQLFREDGSVMPEEETAVTVAMRGRRTVMNQQMGVMQQDGATSWLMVNAVPILGPAGELEGVASTFTDVTDLIIAEEEKAKAVTTNAVIDAMGDGLVVLNIEGQITTVNRAFEKMTGYSRDDLVGIYGANFITNLIKIESGKTAIVKIKETIEGTEKPYGAIILQTKSGEEIPTAITASYMRDEYGEPIAIITTFKDISNVLMLEEALHESNERFQRITAYANDAIFLVDDKGRISYWNPAAEKIFGYARVEAEGKRLTQLILPSHVRDELVDRMTRPTLPEQEPFIRKTVETLAKRKSGEEFPIELSFSILIIKGSFHTIGIVRDITERKDSERALRESEQLQKALFDGSIDPIILTDLNDRIINANPAMEGLFGFGQEELVGQKFPGHEGIDEGKLQEWVEICRTGRGISDYETVRRTKEGKLIPVSISISPIMDMNGNLISLSFWYRDITERKRAEERLRFQAHLLNSVRESIVASDMDGRITYWGRGAENLYQYSYEEVMGDLISFIVDPGHQDEEQRRRKSTRETGSWTGERRLIRKDGTPFLANTSLSLVRDSMGNPSGIIGIDRDITELKQTEDALRDSEERYRVVTDTVFAGITIVNSEDEVVFLNAAFAEMTGYTREEILGMSILDITDHEEFTSHRKTSLEDEESRTSYETTVARKDGTILNVLIAVSPLTDRNGLFTGTLCVFIDISERIESEERIRASLNEKEVMLKEIHHRVKNNLQVVSSLLYLQSEKLKDDHGRSMLRESQNRVKSMALVHERLYQSEDLARIDFAEYIRNLSAHLFHSFGLDPGRINLNTKVDQIFMSIEMAIPCGLVINELVSNALKHAFPEDKKGTVTIGLSYLVPEALKGEVGMDEDAKGKEKEGGDEGSSTEDTVQPERKVVLVIEDNGVGLPEEVDFLHTESMGLHLVSTLIKQLGAEIELDVTGGTRFTITFGGV